MRVDSVEEKPCGQVSVTLTRVPEHASADRYAARWSAAVNLTGSDVRRSILGHPFDPRVSRGISARTTSPRRAATSMTSTAASACTTVGATATRACTTRGATAAPRACTTLWRPRHRRQRLHHSWRPRHRRQRPTPRAGCCPGLSYIQGPRWPTRPQGAWTLSRALPAAPYVQHSRPEADLGRAARRLWLAGEP